MISPHLATSLASGQLTRRTRAELIRNLMIFIQSVRSLFRDHPGNTWNHALLLGCKIWI